VHFRVNSFPIVANFEVFRLGTGTATPCLQMNSTGNIKLVVKGNLTTGFSASPLIIGEWYQADVRLYGYVGDGTEAGRRKESVTVYDSNGATVFAAASPTQSDSVHASLTPANGGYGGPAGTGACPGSKVTEARITVSSLLGIDAGWLMALTRTTDLVAVGTNFSGFPAPSAAFFNTSWNLGYSENQSFTVPACDFPANFSGKMYEVGTFTIFNEPIGGFRLETADQLESHTLVLGDPRSTPRAFDYDDLWFDVKVGDDVDGDSAFPAGTHITLNTITSQGPFDQFTTAGNFSAVAETPLGTGTITGTFGLVTDYHHLQLEGSVTNVEHVRFYMNAHDSSAAGDHYILFDDVVYPVIAGATIVAGAETIVADRIGIMARGNFNAATVGVQNNESGHTLTIGNLYMEVLNGPATTIAPTYLDACSTFPSAEVVPGDNPLSPVDDIFGEC